MAAATCTLCPLKSSVVCTFRPAPSQGLVCTVRVGVVRIRCGDGDIRVVSKGAPKQQHLGVVEQLAADLASTSSTSVDFRERMRRERISHSNKGKVPWNKGRRHSPETIAKIKERTKLAMLNPEIRDKLRQCGKNQSKETKAKIRSKMVGFWESKRAMKQAQLVCVREWKEAVAEGARVGYCAGDEEYRWDSYKRIQEQYRLEGVEARRREKEALRARVKEERAMRKKKPISDAHRKAISDAIRAKWADPAYQAKVSAGMAKIDAERRQRRVDQKRVRVVVAAPKRELGVKRKAAAAVPKTPATVAAAVVEEVHPVEKRRPVQVDEDFIAEVLAEEVTLKTKSERSTAARIKGPRKVTLVSLEDHKKTDEVEDTPSLRPEDVQLSSKLTSQSYKDPFVLEKVQRIQQLRKGRLEVELKRKEAADRARMLIADAERAASALEQSGKTDAATMGKLMETRKLLAEATRAMQATEMKQQQQHGASANFQPGSSRSRNSNENEELLSLSTGGDFHSRIRPYPSGDNLADCPHPIPIRIRGMRPSEHQRRGNGNGRARSTSIRATLKDETQATDTEDCHGN